MKSFSNIFIFVVLAGRFGHATCVGTNLRASRRDTAGIPSNSDERSECTVTETLGSPFPGEKTGVSPTLNCETEPTNPILGDSIFLLTGETDRIFGGRDFALGEVRISFPLRAINKESDEIVFNDDTMKEIRIIDGGGRRRLNVSTTGTKYILVIRVSGFSNGELQEVSQSKAQLSNDIFHYGNNNLKTVYKSCSAGKLLIKPARTPEETITNVVNGVIDVQLSTATDICSLNYVTAGNIAIRDEIISSFSATPKRKVTHKMIVFPDCVDFEGAAAWGQVLRTTTWFKSKSVAFPATQVHEIGHNLGMLHSGKMTSEGYDEYADGTGYMSNMINWDEEGNQMCFNAAKMWYFGWYSDQHKSFKPSSNETTLDLVALDDIKTGKLNAKNKISILELVAEGGSSNLYVMFNRAKGMNAAVLADRNKTVIIEQSGPTQPSQWKGAVGPSDGDAYTQANWGETGKTLVIRSENIMYGGDGEVDFASIKVYVTTATVQDESLEEVLIDEGEQCSDVEDDWHDIDGPMYNCEWYAEGSNCAEYGYDFENEGYTAMMACCTCKEAHDNDLDNSPLATRSNTDDNPLCEDDASWYDQQGPDYTCEWYSEDLNRCKILGSGYKNFGKTAKEACCICKEYEYI